MKLIYCEDCGDLFKLSSRKPRYCQCKKCAGMYLEDKRKAIITKEAYVLTINNITFAGALEWSDNIFANMHTEFAGNIIGKGKSDSNWIEIVTMDEFKARVKQIKLEKSNDATNPGRPD